MAAADHEHPPSGIGRPIAAEDVRDAVGDAVAGRPLARHRQPVHAHRVWRAPGAGGVDDRARLDAPLGAVAITPADHERRVLPPGRRHLVEPGRVTASTVAPKTRCGAIAGCAASGAR